VELLKYNLDQLRRGVELSARRAATTAPGTGGTTRATKPPAATRPVPLGAVQDSGAPPPPPAAVVEKPAPESTGEGGEFPPARPAAPAFRVAPVPKPPGDPLLNLPVPPAGPASQPANSPFRPIPRGP
jgi:hypothetical protein